MRTESRTSNIEHRASFDKWYDSIEKQVDRFMTVAEKVLFYSAIAGVFLLVIVQIKKAVG